jgi:malic enzyme
MAVSHIEDVAAPACFEIEDRLRSMLDIPVFHDDQHGTAIISLAGLKNYLLLSGKKIEEIRIVTAAAALPVSASANFSVMPEQNISRCAIQRGLFMTGVMT